MPVPAAVSAWRRLRRGSGGRASAVAESAEILSIRIEAEASQSANAPADRSPNPPRSLGPRLRSRPVCGKTIRLIAGPCRARWPKRWTGMIALVAEAIRSAIKSRVLIVARGDFDERGHGPRSRNGDGRGEKCEARRRCFVPPAGYRGPSGRATGHRSRGAGNGVSRRYGRRSLFQTAAVGAETNRPDSQTR